METILITGATGIVGQELVRSLVAREDRARVKVLLRGTPAQVREKLALIRRVADPRGIRSESVEAVIGDITRPLLGLSPADLARLTGEVTRVLHCAAVTSFKQTLEQATASNVTGTAHALDFAAACTRPCRFAYIGSAYASGSKSGIVLETDIPSDGFFNEYERSKAAAEAVVRARNDVPSAIYRLSIVVGRQTDGRIARFEGVYQIWRLFHSGLLPMVPGNETQPIDLVPADYCAEATTRLFLDRFTPGRTYHVCAGPQRSLKLGEFFGVIRNTLNQCDPAWKKHGYPLPAHVSDDAFASFFESMGLVGHKKFEQLARQVRTITVQLQAPKAFSTEYLERDLQGAMPLLTHAREWFGRSIEFAVAMGWDIRNEHAAHEVAHAA